MLLKSIQSFSKLISFQRFVFQFVKMVVSVLVIVFVHVLQHGLELFVKYVGISANYMSTIYSLTVAICTPTCSNGGTCSSPGVCTCASGWNGTRCTIRKYLLINEFHLALFDFYSYLFTCLFK